MLCCGFSYTMMIVRTCSIKDSAVKLVSMSLYFMESTFVCAYIRMLITGSQERYVLS